MEKCQKLNSDHRVTILSVFFVIVLVWTIAGACVWTGCFRDMAEMVPATAGIERAVSVVMGLTTWPAHELSLQISGEGFGANARLEFKVVLLVLCFAWAALLWSPILILLKRNLSYWIAAAGQAALLALVIALFWKFGNG